MKHTFLLFRGTLTALIFLALPSLATASEKWWETGHLSGFPANRYMTALGYGQTVRSAQSDAIRSLSQQLSSKIGTHYRQSRETSGMTTRRSVRDVIDIRTKAKLVNIVFPKTRWLKSQGSYVVLAALDIPRETRYLSGRVRNLERNIRSLRDAYDNASDPLHRIRILSQLIQLKEEAGLFDRERAILSGQSPSSRFDVDRDVSHLENRLARDATFTVSVVGLCNTKDALSGTVSHHLTEGLTRAGLVGSANGKILITGQVSSRPMGEDFSRRYVYYAYHYHFTVRGPGGQIWGEVAHDGKAAGITPAQARMMVSRRIAREGVRPLVKGITSRLFYRKGSGRFVALPRGGGAGSVGKGDARSQADCGSVQSRTRRDGATISGI